MATYSKTSKSIIVVMFFSIISSLLGFLREVLIASEFGSGIDSDTYFMSIGIVTLLTLILNTAITTTYIPVYSEVVFKEGKQEGIRLTNNLLNIYSLISLVIIISTWIFSPIIIKVVASGFSGEQFNLAVNLLRIGLPSVFFSSLVGIFKGYLQSDQNHFAAASISVPANIVYIIFLLFFASIFGVKGLMITSVIAFISQLLVLIPATMKSNYSYEFLFDFNNEYVKKIIHLSIPVLISVAIDDINIIVDRSLASNLVSGSISSLNYANRINNLVRNTFVLAVTTVIFPLLSQKVNNKNLNGFKNIISKGINLILLMTIPVAIGIIILAEPIVALLFQRGEFTISDTRMTAYALIAYSLGLVGVSLKLLLTNVYHSMQDMKTPMVIGAVTVMINVILNIILVNFLAHAGLALATSIATTISVIIMYYSLRKKIGSVGGKELFLNFLKISIASIIMGIVANSLYALLMTIFDSTKLFMFLSLLIVILVSIIVYAILCYLFKITEIINILDKIKLRFTRK